MKDVIVIKPGRPEGYVEGACKSCGFEGYFPKENVTVSNEGGRYGGSYGYTTCPNCGKPVAIPVSELK